MMMMMMMQRNDSADDAILFAYLFWYERWGKRMLIFQ